MNDWKQVASSLLSIPMAHQLIGFYTVADRSDGILKVMRSYEYYAASAISDKVSRIKWGEKNQRVAFYRRRISCLSERFKLTGRR